MDPVLKVSEIIEIYESLEEWTEVCINQDDIVNASECKTEISQLMCKIISQGYTRPKVRLYGKLNRLDIKISKFILLQLRTDYVEMESPDEDDENEQVN